MEEAVGSSKAPGSDRHSVCCGGVGGREAFGHNVFPSLWQHLELCYVINLYFLRFFKPCFPSVGAVHCCFPRGVH